MSTSLAWWDWLAQSDEVFAGGLLVLAVSLYYLSVRHPARGAK